MRPWWVGVLAIVACTPVERGDRRRAEESRGSEALAEAEAHQAFWASAWAQVPPSTTLPQAPCDMLRPWLDDDSLFHRDGRRQVFAIGMTDDDEYLVVTARPWYRRDARVFFGPAEGLTERRVLTIGTERDGGSMPLLFDLDGRWVHARFPAGCPSRPAGPRAPATVPFTCDGVMWDAPHEVTGDLRVPADPERAFVGLRATCFSQTRQEQPPR